MASERLLSGPSVPPRSGGAPKQLIVLLHGVGADGGGFAQDGDDDFLFGAEVGNEVAREEISRHLCLAFEPDRRSQRLTDAEHPHQAMVVVVR